MRTLSTLATLLLGLAVVFWASAAKALGRRICAIVVFAALMLTISDADQVRAGLILQASDATATSEFNANTDPTKVIDQSGLSSGYTSLVTDFDTYLASGVTYELIGGGGDTLQLVGWFSAQLTTVPLPLNFDFDLGGTFSIESFAMWGDNQPNSSFNGPTNQSVNEFELLADDNSDFLSPISLGIFNYTNTDIVAEIFSFDSTLASYMRMVINSNHGDLTIVGFGEAVFEVTDGTPLPDPDPDPMSVPEPSTLALFGIGLAGLGFMMRRRRRST